jgi:small subunit ribosomal protein S13
MAIVSGVNIPDNKRVEISLMSIYGIGRSNARKIVDRLGLDPGIRVKDLLEDQLSSIREIVDKEYKSEGDLRREVQTGIRRLMDIGSYKGLRHRRGLPVRGQNTKTNARTRKGAKKTVAGRGRIIAKK